MFQPVDYWNSSKNNSFENTGSFEDFSNNTSIMPVDERDVTIDTDALIAIGATLGGYFFSGIGSYMANRLGSRLTRSFLESDDGTWTQRLAIFALGVLKVAWPPYAAAHNYVTSVEQTTMLQDYSQRLDSLRGNISVTGISNENFREPPPPKPPRLKPTRPAPPRPPKPSPRSPSDQTIGASGSDGDSGQGEQQAGPAGLGSKNGQAQGSSPDQSVRDAASSNPFETDDQQQQQEKVPEKPEMQSPNTSASTEVSAQTATSAMTTVTATKDCDLEAGKQNEAGPLSKEDKDFNATTIDDVTDFAPTVTSTGKKTKRDYHVKFKDETKQETSYSHVAEMSKLFNTIFE